MRIVFIGGGTLTRKTAALLIKRHHEVVIIEQQKERLEAIADEFDCGLIHGDGSKPAVLREVDPEHCDLLFCVTGNDQTNIISALVGRSLGFAKVVVKVSDEEFEHICIELGLENTIVPVRTSARYLADMVEGQNILELSSMIKGEARTFSFVLREQEVGPLDQLGLPKGAKVICLYRNGEFILPEEDEKLKEDDEVVVITHSKVLNALRQWRQEREQVVVEDEGQKAE